MRQRPFIRAHFACAPRGCGARPGEPCVAYVPRRGKTTGKPTLDVHAARWERFFGWLHGEHGLDDEPAVHDTPGR
jgi:hypothetical protein